MLIYVFLSFQARERGWTPPIAISSAKVMSCLQAQSQI